MIKDFKYFINESNYDSFSEIITSEILTLIKQSSEKKNEYDLSYDDTLSFDLDLTVIKALEFSTKEDPHFSQLPWEDINFKRNGFTVDANSYVPKSSNSIPEIEMIIIVNKKAEPNCYQKLYFKILETIRHELEHLMQKGFNIRPDSAVPANRKVEDEAQSSYKYFLLDSELPSMVKGMHLSAVKKRIPIDQEFEDYLTPFLDSNFITKKEFMEVMRVWLDFAIKKYPMVKISNKYLTLVKPSET